MKKLLEKQILRNLLSALLFGGVYSLLSFADKGYVRTGAVCVGMLVYFILVTLLSFVAPKLRKVTGHDTQE